MIGYLTETCHLDKAEHLAKCDMKVLRSNLESTYCKKGFLDDECGSLPVIFAEGVLDDLIADVTRHITNMTKRAELKKNFPLAKDANKTYKYSFKLKDPKSGKSFSMKLDHRRVLVNSNGNIISFMRGTFFDR